MKARTVKISKRGRVLYDYPEVGVEAKGVVKPRHVVSAVARNNSRRVASNAKRTNKAMSEEQKKKMEEMKKKRKEAMEKVEKSLDSWTSQLTKGGGDMPNPLDDDDIDKKKNKGKNSSKNPPNQPQSSNGDLDPTPRTGERPAPDGAPVDGIPKNALPGVYGNRGGENNINVSVPENPLFKDESVNYTPPSFGKSLEGKQYGEWVEHDQLVNIKTPFGIQKSQVMYQYGTLFGKGIVHAPTGQALVVDLLLPQNTVEVEPPTQASVQQDASTMSKSMQMMRGALQKSMENYPDSGAYAEKSKKKKEEEEDMEKSCAQIRGYGVPVSAYQAPQSFVEIVKSQMASDQVDPDLLRKSGFDMFDQQIKSRYTHRHSAYGF